MVLPSLCFSLAAGSGSSETTHGYGCRPAECSMQNICGLRLSSQMSGVQPGERSKLAFAARQIGVFVKLVTLHINECVLGIPELHIRICPDRRPYQIAYFISICKKHPGPIFRPSFVEMSSTTLKRNGSAKQDHRSKGAEEIDKGTSSVRRQVFSDFQRFSQIVSAADALRTRQIHC